LVSAICPGLAVVRVTRATIPNAGEITFALSRTTGIAG
jgi:hypothetical protein